MVDSTHVSWVEYGGKASNALSLQAKVKKINEQLLDDPQFFSDVEQSLSKPVASEEIMRIRNTAKKMAILMVAKKIEAGEDSVDVPVEVGIKYREYLENPNRLKLDDASIVR